MALALAASPATGQESAAHPHPAQGPVIHERAGVVIHYLAHPVGPVPLNQARTTDVYLVCPTYYNATCLGASEVEQTVELVAAVVGIVCAIFVKCPQVWRTIVKGKGKHTQSWKYQEGSKPIYRFVNRFAELAYGRTDVLAQLSKRDGAYLYAKTATQLPSGAYAHWSIFVAGYCSPC